LEGYTTPTAPIRATIEPSSADQKITWSVTEGNDVVNLVSSSSSAIQAVKEGKATLTATSADKKTADCAVTVVPLALDAKLNGSAPPAEHNGVSAATPLRIRKGSGDKVTVSVTAGKDIPGVSEVKWFKDGTALSTTGQSLALTEDDFKNNKETPIRFEARSGSASVYFYVVAETIKVNQIILEDFTLDLRSDKTKDLAKEILTVLPEDATDKSVTWKSEDPAIVEVNPTTGKATAKSVGVAIITVTANDGSGCEHHCLATVTDDTVPPGALTLDRYNIQFASEKDKPQTLTASVEPELSNNKGVIWTTSDEKVVKLDGIQADNSALTITLVPVAPGEAVITATTAAKGANGEPLKAECKVTVSGIQISHKDKDGKVIYGDATINVGEDLDLDITPLGVAIDLTQEDWLWTSDNASVRVSDVSKGIVSGVSVGEATVTCRNGSTKASIKVTVVDGESGNIVKRTMNEDRYGLGGALTGEKPSITSLSQNICGAAVDYITGLTVKAEQGTLYYGYHSEADTGAGVSNSDKFYASAHGSDKLIERITFVPRDGFSGVAVIPFEAVSKNGEPESYHGEIHITVPAAKEITYVSEDGKAVFFHSGDFSDYCKPMHGYAIASVRFPNPPSERYGYLYYDYPGGGVYASNVPATRRYYSASDPSLDGVAFVPREGYTGTFTIPFNGWDAAGNTFNGTIRITVRRSGEAGSGDIAYTAHSGQRQYFDAQDFVDLCRATTGGTLSYVQFTALPDSAQAVLYAGTNVLSANARHYLSASPRLMDVNILPAANFTGTVTVPFTAADTAGKTFEGSVVVKVTKSGGAAVEIYKTSTGMPVTFARSDFTAACKGVLPESLKSVRFYLPSEASGKLYEGFHDLHSNELLASDTDLEAKALTNLVFVPKGGFSGSVYLSYTATDVKDNTCTGMVRVAVWPASTSEYFNDTKSVPWAVSSIDFLRRYGVVTGATETAFAPIQPMGRGDFILMLSRAYAMPEAGRTSFSDVPTGSYYAQALASAKHEGIASGDASGRFYPAQSVTRQDAALFLYRAMENAGVVSGGSASDLSRFPDGGEVAPYAQEAMGALTSRGIFIGDSQGRLNPTGTLTRAEMAVILHRAIT